MSSASFPRRLFEVVLTQMEDRTRYWIRYCTQKRSPCKHCKPQIHCGVKDCSRSNDRFDKRKMLLIGIASQDIPHKFNKNNTKPHKTDQHLEQMFPPTARTLQEVENCTSRKGVARNDQGSVQADVEYKNQPKPLQNLTKSTKNLTKLHVPSKI